MQRRSLLGLSLVPTLGAFPARALESPKGPVVLTITGQVRLANAELQGEPRADFDMAMLAGLRQHGFTAKAPWYRQPRKFTGPLLREVLSAAGAHGSTVRATALDDYRASIPFADFDLFGVLLALRIDDKPIPPKDKGPLCVMYPFDSHPVLRKPLFYGRCIWQLRLLEVR